MKKRSRIALSHRGLFRVPSGIRTPHLAGPYINKYLGPFLAALACLSVESICDLLQPTIMARIVDQGVAARDISIVLRFGLLMLGVAGIGAAGAAGRNIIASLVSYRFGAQLRADLFHRVTAFSFGEMGGFDAASLITRQTNDVTQVQTFVNGVMRIFAKAPILAVGGLVMAVILEPGLSVVLAIAVPAAAVLISINLATGFRRFRRVQEGLDGVNSVTREYLGGIRVVKAFGQEPREVRRFAGANGELTSASTFALRAMALFGPAIALTVNIGIVAVLWIGGYRVAASSLQVGKVIAFINYMSQILFSLNVISMIFTQFVRARASWVRIAEVLGTPVKPRALSLRRWRQRPPGTAGRPSPFRPWSSVESLSPTRGRAAASCWREWTSPARPAASPRSSGRPDPGKSSLAALVPRFYEPSAGHGARGGAGRPGAGPRRAAPPHRPGAAEDGAVHRDHRGEPPLGKRGCHGGRAAGGGSRRAGARVHPGLPRGIPQPARPGRGEPFRRAEAARGHRPRPGAAARGPDPR